MLAYVSDSVNDREGAVRGAVVCMHERINARGASRVMVDEVFLGRYKMYGRWRFSCMHALDV